MPNQSVEECEAKAARARETAGRMVRPDAVRVMLEIAKCYDLLASEARDRQQPPQAIRAARRI